MPDTLTVAERSERMSRVRSRGNCATELRLIAFLRKHHVVGWRRRVRLPGKPDFIFRKAKLALFVDGCFWHGCPRHGRIPKSRVTFWKTKIARNAARDLEINRILQKRRWRVVRIWEHELAKKNESKLILKIQRALIC